MEGGPDPITCEDLGGLLENKRRTVVMIDCRPFLVYTRGHISIAHNTHCPSIVKRRSGGLLPLSSVLPCRTTREKLLAGVYDTVVVYDEDTTNLSSCSSDCTLTLVSRTLRKEAGIQNVQYLSGGYKLFVRKQSHHCTNASSNSVTSSSVAMATTPQENPVEILPHLYLGSATHAIQRNRLVQLGITAILNACRHEVDKYPNEFVYLTLPIGDNNASNISVWFDDANEYIDSVKNAGGKVLLHCWAGVSRSATICIAYLMHSNGYTLQQAYDLVKYRRSVISPNAHFMLQLMEYEKQLNAERDAEKSRMKEKKSAVLPSSCTHQANFSFDFSTTHVQYIKEQGNCLPPLSPHSPVFLPFPLVSPINSPLTSPLAPLISMS